LIKISIIIFTLKGAIKKRETAKSVNSANIQKLSSGYPSLSYSNKSSQAITIQEVFAIFVG